MTDEEKIVAAKGVVDDILAQQFRSELQFDVDVVREFNDIGPGDGSPYLHVLICVNGDFGQLLNREKWTSEFVGNMGDTFAQHGIEDEPAPVTSFFVPGE